MAGLLSNNPEMAEMQKLALLQKQGAEVGDPSVKERLAANKPPRNNPFSIDKFGANNPELQLIKDPNARSRTQRESFFKGLGAAGQSLLQNSNKSFGEAMGAGMGAFTTGADEGMQKGLLVAKEQQKQKALQDFEDANKSGWTRGKKEAWQLSQALEDPTYFKSYSDKDNPYSKIDVNKATPSSVQVFNKKFEDEGVKDFSLLSYPASLKRSTSDNLSAMKAFDAQAAALLKLKFQINSNGDMIIEDFVEGGGMTKKEYIEKAELVRLISENAWSRWYNNAETEGSAVAEAARQYENEFPKVDEAGNPMLDKFGNAIMTKKFSIPLDRMEDQFGNPNKNPAGINVNAPLIK